MGIRFLLRLWFRVLLIRLVTFPTRFRWKLLGFYYNGLAVQAGYLYRQSDLFKFRWQELGLAYAENTFMENKGEQLHFFEKARKEPLWIRFNIFLDGLTGREYRPYYLTEN